MSNVFRFVGGPLDGRLEALESAPRTIATKFPITTTRPLHLCEGVGLPDPDQQIEVGEAIYARSPGKFVDGEWRIPHTYHYVGPIPKSIVVEQRYATEQQWQVGTLLNVGTGPMMWKVVAVGPTSDGLTRLTVKPA